MHIYNYIYIYIYIYIYANVLIMEKPTEEIGIIIEVVRNNAGPNPILAT